MNEKNIGIYISLHVHFIQTSFDKKNDFKEKD